MADEIEEFYYANGDVINVGDLVRYIWERHVSNVIKARER